MTESSDTSGRHFAILIVDQDPRQIQIPRTANTQRISLFSFAPPVRNYNVRRVVPRKLLKRDQADGRSGYPALLPLPLYAFFRILDHNALFGELIANLVGAGEVAGLF